ncbi:MAG: site-specific integrase [Coriobacteriia bacterium]|nr:site-specific integrase [Coriobacteriia bacterium]
MDSHPTLTFADAWEAWLSYRTHSARPLRASTLADYESIYRAHLDPLLGATRLAAIDGVAIAQLTVALSRAGVRPKRLSNVLVPLRACLRWHHRMGTLMVDPSPWFEPGAPAADERRILSPPEIERLLTELPPDARPFVAFAAYVGTRAGEQRALTWADVDLSARTARIDKTYYRDRLQRSTKSGHDRTVPLPVHIAEMLAEWRGRCPPSPAGLVFPGPAGGPLDLDIFRARVFKPAVTRAGLPPDTRIHDLRHSSASLYLRSGATLREVMEIHGWRQMQTAVRYLHTGGELTEAADRVSQARAEVLDSASPRSR